MKRLAVRCLALLLPLFPATAPASSIGIYFDQNAMLCDAQVPVNSTVTWYILALLGGDAAASGITGAEFRQTGTPPTWFTSVTPNPAANIVLGNVVGQGGNIAFQSCTTGTNGILHLYTVSGVAATEVGPQQLRIVMHATPSNPNFACPLLVLCDAPVFTPLCIHGNIAMINSTTCTCCFATEPGSWGRVKALYGG